MIPSVFEENMAKWDPTAGPFLRRHNRFRGENEIAFCSLIVSLSAPNDGQMATTENDKEVEVQQAKSRFAA